MNIKNYPLKNAQIGLERETLRTTEDGKIARSPHPKSLGNVYTHPHITIDYGESLLEIITDPQQSPEKAYQQLHTLHQYIQNHLENGEKLWPVSMPAILPENPEHIEIGYFGESNAGKLKRLYRTGLSYRYGRPMQMIAGVHFNYSPPEALWQTLAKEEHSENTTKWRNQRYMGMLRTIQQHSWLICYLFGASPAVDQSFQSAYNILTPFGKQSLGWENATTLRMSQLGYQNKIDFNISFNRLEEYLNDLAHAVLTPCPPYEYLGLKDPAGNYRQISTNILQIANEYYSAVRPKQVLKKGELPIVALHERGIAYVELRLLDINPFNPCGISLEQIHFLETFMLWALLNPSAKLKHHDYNELNHNRLRTACCGNQANFQLQKQGKKIAIEQWALEILEQMRPVAQALDQKQTAYQDALEQQIHAVKTQNRLPNKIKKAMQEQDFIPWALHIREKQQLPITYSEQQSKYFEKLRLESLANYQNIEESARTQISFDDYLAHYFDPLKQIQSALQKNAQ